MFGAFVDGDDAYQKESSMQQLESYLGLQTNSMAQLQFGDQRSWYNFDSYWSWNFSNQDGANPNRNIVFSVPLTVVGTPLDQIANGYFDDHFKNAAQQIAAHNPNAIIRLGWEMNFAYSTWSAVGHPWDYINAFRHVVGIFKNVSGGFRFDWCPNIGSQEIDQELAYPGDDVVDIIGLDYYEQDWQSHQYLWDYNTSYESWADPRGLQWHADFAARHGKPMSFPEIGSGKNGDDGFFVQHMYDWINQHNVVYVDYWDSGADYFSTIHWNQFPNIGATVKNTLATYAGGGGPKNPPPSGGGGSNFTVVGSVFLQNQQTGLCVDTGGRADRLYQYTCVWNPNQQFDLLKYSDGSFGLRSAANGQCINNWGDSQSDGTAVGFYDCAGTPNSRYFIWPDGSGASISNVSSQKCLDPGQNNYDTQNPAYVQWQCYYGQNQIFNIYFNWGSY